MEISVSAASAPIFLPRPPAQHAAASPLRRALEESGLRPWPRMELELFSGEGGVLILARPATEFSVSLADYALPFLLR